MLCLSTVTTSAELSSTFYDFARSSDVTLAHTYTCTHTHCIASTHIHMCTHAAPAALEVRGSSDAAATTQPAHASYYSVHTVSFPGAWKRHYLFSARKARSQVPGNETTEYRSSCESPSQLLMLAPFLCSLRTASLHTQLPHLNIESSTASSMVSGPVHSRILKFQQLGDLNQWASSYYVYCKQFWAQKYCSEYQSRHRLLCCILEAGSVRLRRLKHIQWRRRGQLISRRVVYLAHDIKHKYRSRLSGGVNEGVHTRYYINVKNRGESGKGGGGC